MSDFLRLLAREDVKDPKTFAGYCQQTLGVPYPTGKDLTITRKFIKQLFEHYPNADYHTLCRVVDWCLSRKKRPPHVHGVIQNYRYAWSDGFLPELDPQPAKDEELEQKITALLRVETHPVWRYRFSYCQDVNMRRKLYENWKETRQMVVVEGIFGGTDSSVS